MRVLFERLFTVYFKGNGLARLLESELGYEANREDFLTRAIVRHEAHVLLEG